MNSKVLNTLEYYKIIAQLQRHASSDAGKGKCAELLPMTDIEQIRTAQIQTTDAVNRLRKKAGPSYRGIKNILPSLRRLAVDSDLSCQDLLEISGTLDVAASAVTFLSPESDEEEPDSLSAYYEAIDPCTDLNNEIKRCILGYDEVADDASPALKDIRRKINQTNVQIQKTLSNYVTSSAMKTYLQDSVVTMRNGRYCIPVKTEHKNHVPGMVHDTSGSGNTVFIEPMGIVKLNNELKELSLAEEAEIRTILYNLSVHCRGYMERLETDYRFLAELDFILAKARYSEQLKANAPEFNENGYINLKKARHPLLDQSSAVPINVQLGGEFSMLIVTGPNTGGKTVSLKTVGLLVLMGQSGLHIPALEGSTLGIFKEVYADIGDEQSIEQSLSTFSSHMTNIVKILEAADSESLVLLDELCSGTDPTEGAALAESILTRLHNFGTRVMATTHYSELKVFALSTEGVQNACCEFDVETLRPTYRLLTGLPGKSNAFAISEKLGLDRRIIDEARERIDTGNVAFEDMLADIEINKKTSEMERDDAEKALAAAMATKERYEKEKADFEKKRDKILQEAREEASEVLQEAKDYADMTIREIRKISKNSDLSALEKTRSEAGKKAKQARESMSREPGRNSGGTVKKILTAEDIKVGDTVRVISMDIEGKVCAPADGKGRVKVAIGNMHMDVRLSDLEAAAPEEPEKDKNKGQASYGHLQYSKSMGISTELKLLGMTVDEALIELDKYLDDACMAHLTSARIVHGKGTGALRNAVRQHLKKDKRVKSFKQAEYGEGDAGVTVVEFK